MMFAALSDEAVQQVAEVVKQTLAGTPDAARSEPFTWVMLLGFIAVVAIFVIASYFLLKQHNRATDETTERFSEVIKTTQERQSEMQDRCHLAQMQSLQMATDANSRSIESSSRAAGALEKCTLVLERVVDKLA